MDQLRIPQWLELAEILQNNILALILVYCKLICKVPRWKQTPELLCLQKTGTATQHCKPIWPADNGLQPQPRRSSESWIPTTGTLSGAAHLPCGPTVAEPFLFVLVGLHLKQEWPRAMGRIKECFQFKNDTAASEAAVLSLCSVVSLVRSRKNPRQLPARCPLTLDESGQLLCKLRRGPAWYLYPR